MARKPLSELSPAYRQRIERYAAKHGVSVNESRKAARGHTRSEGHGFPVHNAKHGKHDVKEVGKPVGSAKKYKGAKTPTVKDIKKLLDNVKGENIVIYVQVISTEDSPGRRKEGEASERKAEWVSIKDTKENLLEDVNFLKKSDTGEQLFENIFHPLRPVEAVIAWQIRELDE